MKDFESDSKFFKRLTMKYIQRALEPIIRHAAETNKAVLLTGARQVGKSTLLKHVFRDGYRFVSLDDPFLEQQAKTDGGMFLTLNPPPLVIDEVQRAPELFRHIKIRCDESDGTGLFCLSGSQPFHLMKGVSETLSGRIRIIELNGLSLRELQNDSFSGRFLPTSDYVAARSATASRPDNIWSVIHRGGYPALQAPGADWAAYYGDYVKTYLERDIRELSAVQDLNSFRRFLISAAARTGQLLNYSSIAEEIGKDVGTVKRWISLLEASGVIYLLEPFANSVLRRAIKTPKLFFRDTGLVCYLTRWLTPETLAYGAMSGHIFETFAVSEILKSFANSGLDYRHFVSFYRGHDKITGKTGKQEIEIDLIIEENGILYPVEIKQNANVTSSESAAFQVLDKITSKKRGRGAIVCTCPQPGILRENVLQIPVWYI